MQNLTNTFRISASVAALVACHSAASAHHPGGAGGTGASGPIHTLSAETLRQGQGVVGIVVDYQSLDELSDATLIGAAEEAAAEGEEHSTVHSLSSIAAASLNLAYGATSDLTISFRLPYVIRTDIREGEEHEPGEFETHLHGDADGLGDLTSMAQWRFWNAGGFQSALIGGVTAPTGKTNESDREGEIFDAEFQPGSGAWQGHFGMALTQRSGGWSFDASAIYSAVSEGTQSTDLGDRFAFGAAVSYRVPGFGGGAGPMYAGAHAHTHAHARGSPAHTHGEPDAGPTLDLIVEVNGEWAEKQDEGGEINPDSGGTVVYVSPGARLTAGEWSGFTSVGIPVVNDLNGIQSEPDWRIVSGVSVGF
ncbi:MAG: hypothetical protein NW216_08475 [Hyphomicrobium sp.]|nr:hypothetical protein [Hyphomicrobium sp.]